MAIRKQTIEWLQDEKGVISLFLNRPELHNAFNEVMIEELTSFFVEQAENEECRLVVLRAHGPSFCAGADLHWMKKMVALTKEENFHDAQLLNQLFQTINHFPKPLIAAVHGSVLGGGVGLVSVCDYVAALDKGKWGFTEVRLGLIPAVISPFVMAKIGESAARSSFLSGSFFTTRRAYEWGLVHEVVDDLPQLNERVEAVIKDMLLAGPKAQCAAKKLISQVSLLMKEKEESTLTQFTCEQIASLRVSNEGQEGMNALLSKRKPEWSRRVLS